MTGEPLQVPVGAVPPAQVGTAPDRSADDRDPVEGRGLHGRLRVAVSASRSKTPVTAFVPPGSTEKSSPPPDRKL